DFAQVPLHMTTFNIETGQLYTAKFANPTCRMVFCADWAPIRAYTDLLSNHPGSAYCSDILRELAQVDFRIVNVEAVLHENPKSLCPQTKEGPNLVGPASAVDDLVAVGFNVALLANNHIYDYGLEGLESTRSIVEAVGLRSCGTGKNQENAYDGLVLKQGGIEIALINFQEGEEGPHTERAPEVAGWDLQRVCASIRHHVGAGRTVIALPHADREFLPFPAPFAQRAYRSLVDAGAALVIAHHPHVPRGVELYQGVPIFYSQGNFLFNSSPDLFVNLATWCE
ncbi:MAG: CapA family protein, partial [Verrucomicrobia bacterium]|nr:CapA family protein [Verrucomicrobiota bacterium]